MSKSQIPMKSQLPMSNGENFRASSLVESCIGNWTLGFGISLGFGIWTLGFPDGISLFPRRHNFVAPLSSSTMREAITDTFRKALSEAQSAARDLNQDFVGTEYFMLGLLASDGEATHALRSSHGEPAKLKSVLEHSLPRGEQEPVVTGDLPLSPRAQRVINGAIVKAQSMRESRVSTRFLLLSLLDEPGTVMREALDKCGV